MAIVNITNTKLKYNEAADLPATVAITKKGEQVFARMQVHFAKIEKQELDGFSKEEEALLRSLLQRMYRNLTGEELE